MSQALYRVQDMGHCEIRVRAGTWCSVDCRRAAPAVAEPSENREFAVLVQGDQLELRALLPGTSGEIVGLETE